MKKTRVIVLILVLVLSQFAIGFADDALAVQKERQYKQAEYDGVVVYNEIMKAFSESGTTVNAAQVKENSVKLEPVFPESYGGAYTDPETGKLVVCLTKDETGITSFKNDVKRIVENTELSSSNNVVYKDVTYSYNTLMKVVEEILPAFIEEEKRNGEHTVSAFYTRFTENQVVVALTEVNETNIERILTYVSNSLGDKNIQNTLLRFEEGNGSVKEEASLKAGGKISIWVEHPTEGNEYGVASVGFRAKQAVNGEVKQGFVTAAHTIRYATTNTWKKGAGVLTAEIGITGDSEYTPSVDAVFVELLPGHTVSTAIDNYHKTYNPNTYSAVTHQFVTENLLIAKSGAESRYTTGHVISQSFYGYDGDVYHADLILTDYYSWNGDSGGLVFYDNGGSEVFIIGIHKGRYEPTVDYSLQRRLVVKAENILDALNLSLE